MGVFTTILRVFLLAKNISVRQQNAWSSLCTTGFDHVVLLQAWYSRLYRVMVLSTQFFIFPPNHHRNCIKGMPNLYVLINIFIFFWVVRYASAQEGVFSNSTMRPIKLYGLSLVTSGSLLHMSIWPGAVPAHYCAPNVHHGRTGKSRKCHLQAVLFHNFGSQLSHDHCIDILQHFFSFDYIWANTQNTHTLVIWYYKSPSHLLQHHWAIGIIPDQTRPLTWL